MSSVRVVAGRVKRQLKKVLGSPSTDEAPPAAPSPAPSTVAAPEVPDSPDEYEKFRMNRRQDDQPEVTKYVPYLLHSALPHSSNGYAIRSHGILTALRAQGWDAVGITQPGFGRPKGESYEPNPETGELPDFHKGELVDSVPYRHLNYPATGPGRDKINAYVADYVARIREEIGDQKPLLIHAASNHLNGLAAIFAANELGIASIYEVRGLWEVTRRGNQPTFFYHPNYHHIAELETQAAREATYCIAISEQLKEELVLRGVPADRIFVAPNGTDPDRHTPEPVDEALREELGLQNKFVVGYVGSVVAYEGLDLLVEAAKLLGDSVPNLHVLIVGDGENFVRLERLVRFLGVQDRVTLTGRVPHGEVGRYSSLIDVVALPRTPLMVSDLVPPLKPFEAMAQERPVLVSDVATMADFIDDGENGFVFRRGDARALAKKIAELEQDRELLARVGKHARQWVIENRTWAHSAAVISEIYQRIWDEAQSEKELLA